MATTSTSQRVPEPAAERRRGDLSGAARALLVALVAAVLVVVVYMTSVATTGGQRIDESVSQHLATGREQDQTLTWALRYMTAGSVVLVVGICMVIALVRRRWLPAAAAVTVVTGATVTAELLKHEVLKRPDLGWGTLNTLPSGHTAVVTSLVLAALLVVPPAARWLVSLLGSVGVAVTGIGTVVAGWHRPSDVVAGFAVALVWGCGALAVMSLYAVEQPHRAAKARPAALLLGLSMAAGVFVSLGVRPDGTLRDLVVHVVTMGVLALLGAFTISTYARMVDVRVA